MNSKRLPDHVKPFPLGSQAAPIRHLDRHSAWSVPISPTVTIVNDPPYRSVYVHGLFQSRFHLARPTDERYALVMLVEGKCITQRRLADAYGFDHDTINNWVRRYRDFGATGLLRSNPAQLKPLSTAVDPAVTAETPSPQQIQLELAPPEAVPAVAPATVPSPVGSDAIAIPAPSDGQNETAAGVVESLAERDVLPVGVVCPTRYAGYCRSGALVLCGDSQPGADQGAAPAGVGGAAGPASYPVLPHAPAQPPLADGRQSAH